MRVYLLNSLLFFSYFWMHSQNSAMISRLETFDITTNERSLIREENSHFEAPNWSADGHYFIINQDGLLYNISGNGKKRK